MQSPRSERLPKIAVCVCTYKRNEPLKTLLESVKVSALALAGKAEVGIVIADDNPDGAAKPIADQFQQDFDLGVRYVKVGKGNISLVRNAALDEALGFADFYASTDDDCIVPPQWLSAHFDVLEDGHVHAATSRLINKYPPGSPQWLADEPFDRIAAFTAQDGDRVELAATNNSMINAAWLRANPNIRFREELGVLGGEDMVFFTEAHRAGLTIQFVDGATIDGMEPASRANLKYQLRSALWLGNTMSVTALTLGTATRPRLFLRGVRRLERGILRSAQRLVTRQSPQLRFSIAVVLQGFGQVLGSVGIRLRHH
jgi:succinoglycan biosynthesis protein ExoM